MTSRTKRMIAIYCRVSTEGQRDKYSLKQQRDDGIAFALGKQSDYRVYEDVWSGKVLTRDGWNKLVSDIESGAVTTLWIKTFDRLSRNTRDALGIIEIMQNHNIEFCVDGTYYDVNDHNVQMLLTIQYAVATNEGQNISTRSLQGKRAEIDAGKRTFCYVYGYNYRYKQDGTKEWYVVPEQADTIRYIFKLSTEDRLPLSQIVRRLNAEGHRPLKVDRWEPSAVSRILKRLEYAGYTYNTKKEIIESQIYAPVIDYETWHNAQGIYEACITSNSRRGRNAAHPATNVVKCARCGQGYYYHEGRRARYENHKVVRQDKRQQYAHKEDARRGLPACPQRPKYIPYEVLNGIIADIYIYAMVDRHHLQQILPEMQKSIDSGEQQTVSDIERLDKRIEETKKEIANFKTAIAKGLDIESVVEDIKTRESRITDLEEKKSKKVIELQKQKARYEQIIGEFAVEKIDEYLSASGPEKRKMAARILETCTVDGYTLRARLITGLEFTFDLKEERKQREPLDKVAESNKALAQNPELTVQARHGAITAKIEELEGLKAEVGKRLSQQVTASFSDAKATED